MSASQPGAATVASLAPLKPKTRGFLRIARHGVGPGAMYVITYHRLAQAETSRPRPVAAESAQALIELLERIGIDFRLSEVRVSTEAVAPRRHAGNHLPATWWKTRNANNNLALAA